MPFPEKGNSETVEALINTLTIDGTTLVDANLTTLSDLEHLAELSQDLNVSSENENQITMEEIHCAEGEEQGSEDFADTELGAQEIEIETEHAELPEEILPDVKPKTVPPLRPLTIAPKPTKIPITYKPIAGQQLFLLQSGSTGQQIKLVPQQSLNLAFGKPLAMKPTIKTMSTSSSSQSKVVMKKIVAPVSKPQLKSNFVTSDKHVVVVQKSEPQVVKLASSSTGSITTPTKTITLAQAQQMGLLTTAKLVQQSNTPKQTLLLNKVQQKGVKVINQGRSPTKILPAPQVALSGKVGQRLLLKSGTSSTIFTSNQLIQLAGTQLNSNQIHQINIPGKGVQFIKFVTQPDTTASSTPTITTASIKTIPQSQASKLVTLTGSSLTEGSNIVLTDIKPQVGKINVIAPKPTIKPAVSIQSTTLNLNSSGSQLVMLPASYLQRTSTPKVAIPVRPAPVKTASSSDAVVPVNDVTNLESNGIRPRKPCNCTKSQCLKLYCDCFANGEFCYMCNCMNCFNNIENEEHRQRAIKSCLERNPNAFRPKIGKARDTGDTPIRKHTKGCNCKRSGCLKNYCECYEAKIACSSNCKCFGCRNIEDSMEKKNIRAPNTSTVYGRTTQPALKTISIDNIIQLRPKRTSNNKQAFSYITGDVIEASTLCLLAIAQNVEGSDQDPEVTKKQVIEEFGKCLVEIITCSMNNKLNS